MSTLTPNLQLIEVDPSDLVNSGNALNTNAQAIDTFLCGQQIFNVRAPVFGATGYGTTDATAAIQAALNAAGTAAASNGGAVVLIPPGVYPIEAGTVLTVQAGVTIWAYGAYIFKAGVPTEGILANYIAATDSFAVYNGNSHVRVFGGVWDAKAQDAASGAAFVTMSFVHCQDIIVRDAVFRNTCSYHALEFNSTDGGRALNCRFEGFKDCTVGSVRQFSEAIQIDGSWSSASAAIPLYDGTPTINTRVEGCYGGPATDGSGLGPHGKLVGSHSAGSAAQYTNIQIVTNRVNGALDVGIAAFNWSQSIIANNIVTGTTNYGIRANCPDPATFGFNSIPQDVEIRGNIVESSTASGIAVIGVSSSAYMRDVIVADNIVRSAGSQGILIDVANHISVRGNTIVASASNCINVMGAAAPIIAENWLYHPATNYGIFLGTDASSSIATTDANIGGNTIFLGTGATAGIKLQTGTTGAYVHDNTVRKDGGSQTVAVSCTAGAGTTSTVSNNDFTGFGDTTTTITNSGGGTIHTSITSTNIGTNLG